jgi:tetratricopeptide (TPR) repeat protein
MAVAYRWWGATDEAENLFRWCTTEFEKSENRVMEVRALLHLGGVLGESRHFQEATPTFERTLHLARQINSPLQFNVLLWGLGFTSSMQRKYLRAQEFMEEALSFAKRQAESTFKLWTYWGLGSVHFAAKDFHTAAKYYILYEEVMDEESYLHLDPLERMAISWAKRIGVHTEKSTLARLLSLFLRAVYVSLERMGNPSNWIGRMLWRLYWWSSRF